MAALDSQSFVQSLHHVFVVSTDEELDYLVFFGDRAVGSLIFIVERVSGVPKTPFHLVSFGNRQAGVGLGQVRLEVALAEDTDRELVEAGSLQTVLVCELGGVAASFDTDSALRADPASSIFSAYLAALVAKRVHLGIETGHASSLAIHLVSFSGITNQAIPRRTEGRAAYLILGSLGAGGLVGREKVAALTDPAVQL